MSKGEYAGRAVLQLKDFGKATNADKTNKLSLGNPYVRDESGYHLIFGNPQDPFCCVKLYDFYTEKHLIPAMKLANRTPKEQPFFVRHASGKELKRRVGLGLTCEAGTHRNNKWGEHYFPIAIRNLAVRCGFDNAEKYTMRSG